jgi:DNA-binding MarR family transcriptional regulator
MDEIIVRVARTLACRERLRLLACLVSEGEKTPTDLAGKMRLTPSALSAHLTKLTTAGLIQRRRSGAWSWCIASSPYGHSTLSGKTAGWIGQLFSYAEKAKKDCGLHEVRNCPSAAEAAKLHDLIFESATAFTDLRRLQILRRLVRAGAASGPGLCRDLKMSPFALRRHCDKLLRRGYLIHLDGPEPIYRLADTFKTPIHAQLWQIVRETLRTEKLRTS